MDGAEDAVAAVRWAVTLAGALMLAGCTGDPRPAPTVTWAPSTTTRRLEPGADVELTAVATRVLGPHAFLVSDADLPVGGQLVVSGPAVLVRVTDLVTVAGRVELLDARALGRYGVTDAAVIESSGGLTIVARSVRGYPDARTAPATP
jgi:hypothetical protein